MADITLINTVLPSDVKVPPQGLLYLSAALAEAGFSAEIRDYQFCADPAPWRPETLADFAKDGADVVGFSCMSYALPLVIRAAELIKARAPDTRIILGGIGPSPVARELLDYCGAFDAIVVGEGERTLVELMQRLTAGREPGDVAGIAYRWNGRVTQTPKRARIPSMVDLPAPDYSRLDLGRYRIVDSQYARGCPYSCTFCDIAPFWDRLNTRRPMTHYLDELERLVKRHGARDVFIVDDTFVLSRKVVMEFCHGIKARGIDFNWGCYARVDLMDEELIATMADAGCTKVFYGVESGSDRVLTEVVKETDTDTVSRIVETSLKHFDFVTASFVWGFPNETYEDLQDTCFFLIYLTSLGASPQLNLALPYRYSQLYTQYKDQITFDPQYSSQLQFYRGQDNRWAETMIAERPDLFSCFYQLPTPDFDRKWDYLQASGLSPHLLQHAYDHPIPQPVEAVA
ncbi:MAG: radical SAM protein [Rhodobacter sp.]|nr:radical SAM protein [Rhodobacter sp.]